MLSLRALGKNPSLPLLSFWELSTILGVPRPVDASLESLSLYPVAFSSWGSVISPAALFTKTLVTWDLGLTLTQHDLIFLSYI